MGAIFRTSNPLEYDQVDGIVVDERAAPSNIKGVSTNVIELIARFQRGPESIESVGSTKKLLELYGDAPSFGGNIALTNKKFSILKIRRAVAADAVAALLILVDGTPDPVATLTAKYKGAYGNLLTVVVESGTTGKKITISDTNPKKVINDEVYDNVTSLNIAAELSASLLVDVSAVDESKSLIDLASTPLATGSEGAIADIDYQVALDDSKSELEANVIMLDTYNAATRDFMKLHAAETQDRMVIIGGDLTETLTEVKANVALTRDFDGRIIYAYNWVETRIDGTLIYTPPAHWLGSIISQIGPHIDPASADTIAFLAGASRLKMNLGRQDYIELLQAGVAAFENDSDLGIKLRSGIVTQIANSSKLTILRRRMADFLTNSQAKFFKLYSNKVNSKSQRDALKGAMQDFDRTLSVGAQKILPSDSEVQSGKALLIDTESLNDDLSLGQGKFFIKYKRRIYSSMRFIVLIAEIGETVVVTEEEE